MKINFYQINIYIIYLIPFLLITGPFLPDLATSLLVIFFLFEIIKNNKHQLLVENFFFKFFIFFCLYFVFCSLFAEELFISLKSSLFYFRFGILSLCIYLILKENPSLILKFFYLLFSLIVLVTIDGYIQLVLGKNLLGFELIRDDRVTGLFKDESILGSYLSKIIILTTSLYFFLNEKQKKFHLFLSSFFWLTILLSFILVFFSGERASFYMLLIVLSLAFLMININFKKKLLLLFILLLSFLSVNHYFPINSKRMINQTIAQIHIFIFNSNQNNNSFVESLIAEKSLQNYVYSNQHGSHFYTAYKMFLDKPILGHGPKMFRYKCDEKKYKKDEFSCTTHPHNFLLQLLSETGIIGALFIIFPLIFIFYEIFYHIIKKLFYKKKYLDNFQIISLMSLFLMFWPITTTGNFFNNWLSIIFYFSIGFYIYFKLYDNI